jgi:hypothetical protein
MKPHIKVEMHTLKGSNRPAKRMWFCSMPGDTYGYLGDTPKIAYNHFKNNYARHSGHIFWR